jgi:hypothetical protein
MVLEHWAEDFRSGLHDVLYLQSRWTTIGRQPIFSRARELEVKNDATVTLDILFSIFDVGPLCAS